MLNSKLPDLGISIFSEMSQMANKHQALNLSQGFPEFDAPDFLKSRISHYIGSGMNQYAPSSGLESLQLQIARLINRKYGCNVMPTEAITVTSGATEALFVAIQALIRKDDEVIIFDPAYDSYEPAIELAGGKCIHLPLQSPDYKINWSQVDASVTAKTRAIVLNSPHNPTGSVLDHKDIESLKYLVSKHSLYIISDEVYEHICFEGHQHQSILRYPELLERAFVISSFGKTFHCTGWKMGYCVAPAALTVEFRKIHQYVTFSSFTPAQLALSDMLNEHPQHVDNLSQFYQQKRDTLIKALAPGRFKILPCHGTYFLLLDYSEVSDLPDREFCHWLTKEVGVAAIPLSVFYQQPNKDRVIRLCFAKNDDTLKLAAEKLCQL